MYSGRGGEENEGRRDRRGKRENIEGRGKREIRGEKSKGRREETEKRDLEKKKE